MVKKENKRLMITIPLDLYFKLYVASGRENGYNLSKFVCKAITYYLDEKKGQE